MKQTLEIWKLFYGENLCKSVHVQFQKKGFIEAGIDIDAQHTSTATYPNCLGWGRGHSTPPTHFLHATCFHSTSSFLQVIPLCVEYITVEKYIPIVLK